MRVLITRPRNEANALADRLHALGHATFVEPLIDIVFNQGPNLDLAGVQALLFTSVNGARAAARRTAERAIPVFAVGPATAAEATVQGFTHITESTGEGVEALAQTVRRTLKPERGTLLHATGTVTAGDLKAALAPQGFIVRTEQLYDARAADHLSPAVVTELTAGRIDAATFFSPRTATLFATLIQAAHLQPHCAKIMGVALSQVVADALAPLSFRRVLVAAQPNTAALLDLLKPD